MAPALGKLFFLGEEEPRCCEMLGAQPDSGCTVSVPGLRLGSGIPCGLHSSSGCQALALVLGHGEGQDLALMDL